MPGGALLPLPRPRPDDANRPVKLGVRPEHLMISDGLAASPVLVELVEVLGADTVVYGRLPDGESLLIRMAGLPSCTEGDRLTVAPQPGALHLFDAAHGRRLAD
jgi:sn-glycerol 3-phosphate transport system ATP-binding protein